MKKILSIIFILSAIMLFSSCTEKENASSASPANTSENVSTEKIVGTDKSETPSETSKPTDSPSETNSENNASNEVSDIYYFFSNSDTELIEDTDLLTLGEFSLKLAKNEIFARHGYVFQDNRILDYFNNMPWYEQNNTFKGTMEELNEIEKQNVDFLESVITGEYVIEDLDYDHNMYSYDKYGTLLREEIVTIDFNLDGIEEELTLSFYGDDVKLIVKTADNKEFETEYSYPNITPILRIADFDLTDNLVQFYLESDGPSWDPETIIYSFDGEKIIENLRMIGHITAYDAMSKIYSFDEYSVNCYFDLNNGITPLPKEQIIDTTVSYGNIALYSEPFTSYTIVVNSEFYLDEYKDDYLSIDENKDKFVCFVKDGTPLIVTDIEFGKMENWRWSEKDENGYEPIPWLKVKTPDGQEGWFSMMYGD